MAILKIGVVQYDPQLRQVSQNMDRVDQMLRALTPEMVDILLLPEMAFTGYMFKSPNDIEPFLETRDGPSISWARRTASRLQCYVLLGYPQRDEEDGQAYNSMAVIDRNSDLQTVYRKHFLYDTDKTWASSGPSFETFDLQLGPGRTSFKVSPSICMDLNPKDFVAPFEELEFGTFTAAQKVDLVLCSMNWLASEPPDTDEAEATSDSNASWSAVSDTLSYWVTRLTPLIGSRAVFVASNRIGTEEGVTFTGSSCVIRLGGRPEVLDFATKSREQLLLSTIEL